MAGSLVIVAVPDENDRVWKVSSEKIPHLTLLYLGDDAEQVPNVDEIIGFVEHAANTMLRRFYLPVDRRGELGADQADVLFFKKSRYDTKAVRDFRNALLQDPNVKKAYDAAPQFDGPWQPHLTLGYPQTPAKPNKDDMPFYDVSFNKVAVWLGDYTGQEFLLRDYWDELDEALEAIPMDVAMSDLQHAVTVSDTKWSTIKIGDFTDEQWAKACLLDRGADVDGKQRYGLPVREPDGVLNRNACHSAAAVLSSTGGTGSARGTKISATPEQLSAAKKKLVALYKNALDEDVPEGLTSSMQQTTDLGVEFLSHYGVKGMKWGVHKQGETKKSMWDPEGHDMTTDAFKVALWNLVPPLHLFAIPADVRLARAAARGVQTRNLERQEQKFTKNAQSTKNFVEIHNRSGEKFNREIEAINQKHPGDLTKSPAKQKAYDADVVKLMQDSYREAANSIGNKADTMHLDLEFRNDGQDFVIKAKPGASSPLPNRVKHAVDAADDGTLTFTGKIARDSTGHILGLQFDDLSPASAAHTIDLGAEFLEHYGVKGMKWGVHRAEFHQTRARRLNERADRIKQAMPTKDAKTQELMRQEHQLTVAAAKDHEAKAAEALKGPQAVTPTATSKVPAGKFRKTKIKTDGGENHPAHEDAIKVARAQAKLKKSGPAALSNQELQEMQTRLNLERNVTQLARDTGRVGKGRKFVRNLTGINQEFNNTANTGFQTTKTVGQFRRRPA